MIEEYPFPIPESSKDDLECAMETGALPPWLRYPASKEPPKPSKWNPETAQAPWFLEAVQDWHFQAEDLVDILLNRLIPMDSATMPEIALVRALALMMDDLRALIVACESTWMFDPLVLKAREHQKKQEKPREIIQSMKEGQEEPPRGDGPPEQ
jgi:hypothetical protein